MRRAEDVARPYIEKAMRGGAAPEVYTLEPYFVTEVSFPSANPPFHVDCHCVIDDGRISVGGGCMTGECDCRAVDGLQAGSREALVWAAAREAAAAGIAEPAPSKVSVQCVDGMFTWPVMMSASQRRAVEQAAERDGLPVDQWIQFALGAALKKGG